MWQNAESGEARAHVLVVEAEEEPRALLGFIFGREGYDVTTAASALSALEVLRGRADTKLVVAGEACALGGDITLLVRLRAWYPHIPALVILPAAVTEPADAALVGAYFLRKPFELEELAERARALVAPVPALAEASGERMR